MYTNTFFKNIEVKVAVGYRTSMEKAFVSWGKLANYEEYLTALSCTKSNREEKKNVSFLVRCGQGSIGRSQFGHQLQKLEKIISYLTGTAQKMKFSIKDFFSKCDQICRKLRIWSHLLKKSLMENLIFCPVLSKEFKKTFSRFCR